MLSSQNINAIIGNVMDENEEENFASSGKFEEKDAERKLNQIFLLSDLSLEED